MSVENGAQSETPHFSDDNKEEVDDLCQLESGNAAPTSSSKLAIETSSASSLDIPDRSSSSVNTQVVPRKSQEIVDQGREEGAQLLRDVPSFVASISQFYDNESLSDVIIRVGPTIYRAHKFVLAKSSRVFRTMLYGEGWSLNKCGGADKDGVRRRVRSPCGKNAVELELEESPECQAVFDKFLRFLYSAEVAICSSTAVGILCLADKYDVTSLKDLCVFYMIEWAKSPRVHNALAWYNWAKLISLDSLLKQCTKTIAWNFTEVVSSEEWTRMDVDFLVDFLSSSEIVVSKEYVLYEATVAWLLAKPNRDCLEKYASMLLPLIRFPQLQVSQLYQMENSQLYSMPECSRLLSELASKAYRFRAVCPTQAHLGVCFNEEFYSPRDYIYLTVDTVRIQNTLRFGIQADVKAARSPVPCEVREADWKITYRKQGEVWSLQLYCTDAALLNGEAHIQPTIIIYNEADRVLQVHREDTKIFVRGSTVSIQLTIVQPELAKSMAVLLKPMAF